MSHTLTCKKTDDNEIAVIHHKRATIKQRTTDTNSKKTNDVDYNAPDHKEKKDNLVKVKIINKLKLTQH